MSEDWEVFTSSLLRQQGVAGREAPDLADIEVKSAVVGNSIEYQYHRNSWQAKLDADRRSGHAFVWYGDDLRTVEVSYCDGEQLSDHFSEREAEKPYSEPGQQRFRKQVNAGLAGEHATLLLRAVHGEAEYEWGRDDTVATNSTRQPTLAEG